jgi:hypothetical protein
MKSVVTNVQYDKLYITYGSTPHLISSFCRQCPTSNMSDKSDPKLHNLEKKTHFIENMYVITLHICNEIIPCATVRHLKIPIHSVIAKNLQWSETYFVPPAKNTCKYMGYRKSVTALATPYTCKISQRNRCLAL